MKAVGKPSEAELALLEPLRGELPPAVFDQPYLPPVTGGTGDDRRPLQEADRLLKEAGWQIKGDKRVNAKGEPLELEFLFVDATSERVLTGYADRLTRLGLSVSLRRVDPAQHERRAKSFQFDIVTARFAMYPTPGAELRSYFGSDAAKTEGSRNLSGLAHPAIDALIGNVIDAGSRAELEVGTRALDRVLRASHIWVPQWYNPRHLVAYWDKFSRPAVQPRFARGIIDSWWYDAEKAARLKAN
jgi:microcin C transport system substrate-binding protein